MPYSRNWNNNVPLGSAPANQIDEFFRDLKEDINERMDDIVEDWTADPIELKTLIGDVNIVNYNDFQSAGSKGNDYENVLARLVVHFNGNTSSGGTITINLNEINTLTGDTDWQASNLYVPAGNTPWPSGFVGRLFTAPTMPVCLTACARNEVSNTITLTVRRLDGGTVATQHFAGMITFDFLTVP